MDFTALVNARYSVRAYDPGRPVPRETVEDCLRAAELAPSACNSQPWRFVYVDEPGLVEAVKKEAIGSVGFNRWAMSAPALVVLAAVKKLGMAGLGEGVKDIPYHLMDCGSAGEHLILRAVEAGLGTCWIGWFRQRPLRRLLEIPRSWKPLAIITLGYPAADWEPGKRKRRPLDETAFINSARRPWPGD